MYLRSGPPSTPAQKRRWPNITLILLVVYLLVEFFGTGDDTRVRTQLRTLIKDQFPKQARQYHRSMGLSRYVGKNGQVIERTHQVPLVILIHGLDEPGKVWVNLAPELQRKGNEVWIMPPPMINRQNNHIPQIAHLIMVGTPYHGSHLA